MFTLTEVVELKSRENIMIKQNTERNNFTLAEVVELKSRKAIMIERNMEQTKSSRAIGSHDD